MSLDLLVKTKFLILSFGWTDRQRILGPCCLSCGAPLSLSGHNDGRYCDCDEDALFCLQLLLFLLLLLLNKRHTTPFVCVCVFVFLRIIIIRGINKKREQRKNKSERQTHTDVASSGKNKEQKINDRLKKEPTTFVCQRGLTLTTFSTLHIYQLPLQSVTLPRARGGGTTCILGEI